MEEIERILVEVLGYIKSSSSDSWVSGKVKPIIGALKYVGLPPNSKYTKDFISNLKELDVLSFVSTGRDYSYRWNDKCDKSLVDIAKLLIERANPIFSYSLGDTVYLMHFNNIHQGTVLSKTQGQLVVLINTVKGMKSLMIGDDNLVKTYLSKTQDDLVKKLQKSIVPYQ